MLNVFICEDNATHRKNVRTTVKNYILIEDLDMQVALVTANPYELIAYLKSNPGAGLYFLDIDLNSDLNGINLAEEIRRYDPRGFIVFITTHSEQLELIFRYKLEAMDFVSKDDWSHIDQRIRECIRNAFTKYTSVATELQKNFTFEAIGKKLITIPHDEILYFEISSTSSHKVVLYTLNEMYEFYSKLEAIGKKLDTGFFRCHKSFLINLNKIVSLDEGEKTLFLEGGSACFCSERKMKELKKRIVEK